MAKVFSGFSVLILFSILLRLALSSEESWESEDEEVFKLTPSSIREFTDNLKGDPSGVFLTGLQKRLSNDMHYTCLSYLIGSVAILGQADMDALNVIQGLCGDVSIPHLPNLVKELLQRNCLGTVAQFIADSHGGSGCVSPIIVLVMGLVNENWSTMRELAQAVLDTLKSDRNKHHAYHFMLKCLSVRRQYEMINADSTSLSLIEDLYSITEFDPFLREKLASEKSLHNITRRACLCRPNEFPHIKQFWDIRSRNIMALRPSNLPTLHPDVWCHIFELLDTGSLFVLPLVCKLWNGLYPRVTLRDPRVEDLYIKDVGHVGLACADQVAPWRYHLRSDSVAFRYFGWCIISGALDRAEVSQNLQFGVEVYLTSAAHDHLLLPEFRNLTLYESFLGLFEGVYGTRTCWQPVFVKPVFFSNETFEQAIRYLVCSRGLFPRLDDSVLCDLPRLFKIVGRNGELMGELVAKNCNGDLQRPSIILLMYGQTKDEPDMELIESIFSRTDTFKRLIDPAKPIKPSEYYDFIVESGLLRELAMDGYFLDAFLRLMMSILLYFRNDLGKVARIIASVFAQPWTRNFWGLVGLRDKLEQNLSEMQSSSSGRSSDDSEFIGILTELLGPRDA